MRLPMAPAMAPCVMSEDSMRARCAVPGLLIAAFAAGISAAQEEAEYRLRPGDSLLITAEVGMDDFDPPPSVLVGPDGRFAYPVAGQVQAEGKTRAEVAAAIKTGLETLYRNVRVTVNVAGYRSRDVFVHGEVAKPGSVMVSGADIALSDALAQSGGLTESAGDITLYRSDRPGEDVPVADPAVSAAVRLVPGDVVIVGGREPLTVVGEVGRPGPTPLRAGARLTDVLASIGGLTELADAHHAVLVNHSNRTVVVDLAQVLQSPQGEINLPVAGYHTLIVPRRDSVAVMGEVVAPGLLDVAYGMRLTELLASVGGPTKLAAAAATAVNADGEVLTLEIAAAMENPASAANVEVYGLRTIVIPASRREVVVAGHVTTPGVLTPEAFPISLAGTLIEAGGPTESADLRNVMISYPDGRRDVVDVSALFGRMPATGGEEAQGDVMLEVGALVSVPLARRKVLVFGAVATQGAYEFDEGDTVVDAIALAGGFQKDAGKRTVALLRRGEDAVGVARFDMQAGLRGGEDLLGGELQDGDVVVVSRKKKIDLVGIAATLFSLGRLYDLVND